MSIDPSSREIPRTEHDDATTLDGAAPDAPRSTPLNEVVDNLLEAGAPTDASQIDPNTLEAPFTPITPNNASLESVTSTQESRTPWGKISIIGGTVLGLVAGAAVLFGSRGNDSDTENSVAKPRTTVAGPVTPGAVAPSPSPSAVETQGEAKSPLEEQRQLFERVRMPETAITAAELEEYIDPNALDLFVGVDGGIGLYPEVTKHIQDQKQVFNSLTIEDVAASMDRLKQVMTGTHLDIVDGKVVPVANETLMADGVFRAPITKDMFTRNSEGLTAKGAGVAGTLATIGRDASIFHTAGKMMQAEERVAKYWASHPDETTQISDTNSAGLIESTFASHGTVDASIVDGRLVVAQQFASGEVASLDSPNFADCRVVDVKERIIKNADGSEKVSIIGVSLVGADQGGELFSAFVTLVPAEGIPSMVPKQDQPTFTLGNAPEDSFHALLIGKQSPQ